ncbi:DUF3397 domain-containing protein [Desertibacillus haloalkaliphilus]|uniref:DUF3397 domain-containing protein n=1 Tax=Desertibacillus haloalkaliphilus TaxID=1328930 RepID=UPI001C269A60|nr:DUF3397 domain-containing protein [Desertibacillus haloalkaliphilus]MBU8907122.1 DUF3397 domain-containing protein [Desertibacillus haloalkaliphilus]
MSSALAWLMATVITLPLFGWYLVYLFTVKLTRKKSKAIRVASDVSTLFLICAVYFIMYELWGQSFLWLLMIIILMVAIVFTLLHWKLSDDIHMVRLIRGIWRFNFLLFAIGYVCLSVYGLVISAVGII